MSEYPDNFLLTVFELRMLDVDKELHNMAQVEIRFFDPEIPTVDKQAIADTTQGLVFCIHYPNEVRSRRTVHGIRLLPGDITLIVPALDTDISNSDAQYELEITEGSDNWPKNGAMGRTRNAARVATQARADRVSQALRVVHPTFSHNVFEVNGFATGWTQYKPSGEQA